VVSAALGEPKAATEAFTRLLALSPKATLPVGTSPKIKRPFDAAAKYAASHAALAVKVDTLARPPTLTLVRVSDPLGLVARARVTFAIDGGAERSQDVAVAGERTDVALPAGARIDARVAALDAHGNRLAEVGSKDVPIVIIGDAPPRPAPVPVARVAPVARVQVDDPPRLALYRRWWPYAAVSVAIGGAATYFAFAVRADADDLRRLNADSPSHTFAEAQAVEDRAQRHARYANVALVGAGVFAVTAGVMFAIAPRHRETRVTAVPVAGGGAVVLGGTF